MKRYSIQNRGIRFTPKKFYGIDLKFAPLLTQTNFSFQFRQQVALVTLQEQCSKTIFLRTKLESF